MTKGCSKMHLLGTNELTQRKSSHLQDWDFVRWRGKISSELLLWIWLVWLRFSRTHFDSQQWTPNGLFSSKRIDCPKVKIKLGKATRRTLVKSKILRPVIRSVKGSFRTKRRHRPKLFESKTLHLPRNFQVRRAQIKRINTKIHRSGARDEKNRI